MFVRVLLMVMAVWLRQDASVEILNHTEASLVINDITILKKMVGFT
ncbi:hypothetical protein [Vibrio taketomensis]|nr:hypothetical protein [Vibrio taketomensis]